MSDITIIGLGLMGAALARAVQRGGHDLTVWNRSADKMQPFVDNGASAAADAAGAISASPVVVICIDSYASTQALLSGEDILPLLAGRSVVQLSTGRPKQAAEAQLWMQAHQVNYLDGAILAGPNEIDRGTGEILLSGDPVANEAAADVLRCLAGKVRYLGANVRAASALDLAWLTVKYGEFISAAHAANLCLSEGADLKDLISLFPDEPYAQMRFAVIDEEKYDQCTATLDVWGAALANIQQQGRDADINTDFPDFVASYFKKASAAGFGDKNVMAIFKTLRDGEA